MLNMASDLEDRSPWKEPCPSLDNLWNARHQWAHSHVLTRLPSDTELVRKSFPENYFFVIFEGVRTFKISGIEGLFQGITYETRNFSDIVILE